LIGDGTVKSSREEFPLIKRRTRLSKAERRQQARRRRLRLKRRGRRAYIRSVYAEFMHTGECGVRVCVDVCGIFERKPGADGGPGDDLDGIARDAGGSVFDIHGDVF
jgi:hypothetical protein